MKKFLIITLLAFISAVVVALVYAPTETGTPTKEEPVYLDSEAYLKYTKLVMLLELRERNNFTEEEVAHMQAYLRELVASEADTQP